MRPIWIPSILAFLLTTATAQTTAPTSGHATKDPQAVTILNASLNASGGLAAISSIQDFTETGNITYYWAGEQVQGSVTVRGMGVNNFRVDSSLSSGTRTWAVSGYGGVLITPDGQRHGSAFYNLMTAGSMTLPQIRVAAAVSDTSTAISYAGLVTVHGQQVYQIHFSPSVSVPVPANTISSLSNLGSFDVYIDPTTSLIVRLTETVRSESDIRVTYEHEIEFTNYQPAGTVTAPLTITEKIAGQETWSMALSEMTFNSGLTSATFTP